MDEIQPHNDQQQVESTMTSDEHTISAPLNSGSVSSDESDSDNGSVSPDEAYIEDEDESESESLEYNCENDNDDEDERPLQRRSQDISTNQPSGIPRGPRKRSYTYVTRNQRTSQPANMRKRWKADVDSISNDVSQLSCCKKLQCFKHCDSAFLRSKMTVFRDMTYEQRRLSLMKMKGSNGKFFFDGSIVCNIFLKTAFRFSADLIASVRNGTVKDRIVESFGEDVLSNTTSSSDRGPFQRDAVITCLERLAESSGDKMPDHNEIHLPYFRKRDVYVFFKEEFKLLNSTEVKCPSRSYFYKTWSQYCSTIKVRKIGRFAKCSTCVKLQKFVHDAASARDFKSLAIYRKKKSEHNGLIAMERREYKKKRDKAKLQPDQYLSIIVDGADQSAFGLPHFMIKTKDDGGHSLKVRLIGLLEHNQRNKLRLFTLTEEYPTGANHVVEAIHRFLTERINRSVLPRTFYIQVDNCTKENKNRYMFSYIESLLRWKLFDEVMVSFLPVGHTHEDIDQTFSRTSDRLRCNDAITLSDLHAELRQVYNDQTSVGAMKNVVNWSGLCEKEKCLTNIKNFSKYRYFKFYRRESSESICCMIRVNVTDEWLDIKELSGRGAITSFTKFAPNLANTPPLDIKCPEGRDKITECICAAESRIPVVEKVEALFALRDNVFRERSEPFHWNLQHCVELNQSGLLREDESEEAGDHGDEPQLSLSSVERRVDSDYRYELNTFVAVKTEDGEEESPFWIAKVNQVHRNDDNIITNLTVHWFDKSGNKDVYNCKYFPSYNNLKKKSIKTTPMKDNISVNSVLMNFPALTKQHRLPASVSQHLRGL